MAEYKKENPMGDPVIHLGIHTFWWGNPKEKKKDHLKEGRWEDKIKMDLQEVRCEGIDWIWLRIGTGCGYLKVR
jgi:hypothetical protein